MQDQSPQGRDLSPGEVAAIIGCHAETVRRACRRGEIGYQFGRQWYITRAELEQLRKGAP